MMAKKTIHAVRIGTIAAFVLASVAMAGDSTLRTQTTATVTASGEVANTTDLAFGSFAPGLNGGTVVVASDNSRSRTGTVVLGSSTVSAANFNVTVTAVASARTYNITLPSGATTLTHTTDSSKTMTLDQYTITTAATSGTSPNYTRDLAANATTDAFQVGGTLNVAANQATGNYVGFFDVLVSIP